MRWRRRSCRSSIWGNFVTALGLDAARTAKEQRSEIDVAELRKGITDGLAGTGASSSYVYGLGLGQRLKEFGVSPDLDAVFCRGGGYQGGA